MRVRLAVFASGTGSNFVAISQAVQSGIVDADLALLFSDNPEAPVLTRAQDQGIPTVSFTPSACGSRLEYEQRLCSMLDEYAVDLVALAGYMRIIGAPLLESRPRRILNIHPSLLPAFPGRNSIEDAHAAGMHATGVTVHFIDEGVDTGPIIEQVVVPISREESVEQLEERIHKVEHRLYPAVLQSVIANLQED